MKKRRKYKSRKTKIEKNQEENKVPLPNRRDGCVRFFTFYYKQSQQIFTQQQQQQQQQQQRLACITGHWET